jgi:hypothetical protein
MKRLMLIFFVLLPKSLFAQEEARPDSRQTFSDTSFEQFLNTLFWKQSFFHAQTFGKWQLTATERFQSTLTTFGDRVLRDENQFRLNLSREIFPRSRAALQVSSYLLTDSRGVIGNSSSSTMALMGFVSDPMPVLNLQAFAGGKGERQLGEYTQGAAYQLGGRLMEWRVSNLRLSSELTVQDEFLTPRRNQTRVAGVTLQQLFSPLSSLTLSGGYTEERRDFFSSAVLTNRTLLTESLSNAVETRLERTLFTTDSLTFPLFKQINLIGKVEARERRVTRDNPRAFAAPGGQSYDNEVSVRQIGGELRGTLTTKPVLFSAGMFYQQQEELYRPINEFADVRAFTDQERLRNNNAALAQVAANLTWRHFTKKEALTHWVRATAFVRGFRYDTPDTLNIDDRDEVSVVLTLTDSLSLTENFSLLTNFSSTVAQNVFLNRDRSASNNTNRILRFAPTALWKTERFRSVNEFAVLANYTIFDFEAGIQTRSFSFRQFSFLDSTQISISPTLGVKFLYEQRLYQRAELFWTDFAERPQNSFNDRSLVVSLEVRTKNLVASAGLRAFVRNQKNFTRLGETEAPQILYIGPVTELRYTPNAVVEILSGGWYQVERIGGKTARGIPNMTLAVKVAW